MAIILKLFLHWSMYWLSKSLAMLFCLYHISQFLPPSVYVCAGVTYQSRYSLDMSYPIFIHLSTTFSTSAGTRQTKPACWAGNLNAYVYELHYAQSNYPWDVFLASNLPLHQHKQYASIHSHTHLHILFVLWCGVIWLYSSISSCPCSVGLHCTSQSCSGWQCPCSEGIVGGIRFYIGWSDWGESFFNVRC